MLAALRESVVLYAAAMGGSAVVREPGYVWQVDDQLAGRAALFVAEFNELFDAELPSPTADNARLFWAACRTWKVLGRCVRIGFDDSTEPVRHYHWAIDHDGRYNLKVKDFWDTEIWTTSRYRETYEERL